MTQINPPGYPLPSGELGEDDIVCQLVYLPDRPEYWQAFLAAYHYLCTWRAWERDANKRGKDAASNWREAFEMTMECWRMACLEQLTQNVEDILTFLNTKKDCCDDNLTYEPVDDITTDIVPNEGDPPAYYGETEVVDWDEWNEYLCYTAHKYVDYLAHTGDELYALARFGSISLGVVAGLMALLVASGIGIPIAVGTAAAIVGGITLLGVLTTFEDSHDDIEAARDLIVCAILNDGDIGAVVETALGSDLSWDLWYSLVPYETAKAIMYAGGNDGEYLPAETKDDCAECVDPPDFMFNFTEDEQGWAVGEPPGSILDWNSGGWLEGIVAPLASWRQSGDHTVTSLEALFSITRPIIVARVTYDCRFAYNGESPAAIGKTYLALYAKVGGWFSCGEIDSRNQDWDEWFEVEALFDPPLELVDATELEVLQFWQFRYNPAWTNERVEIDNIRFYSE